MPLGPTLFRGSTSGTERTFALAWSHVPRTHSQDGRVPANSGQPSKSAPTCPSGTAPCRYDCFPQPKGASDAGGAGGRGAPWTRSHHHLLRLEVHRFSAAGPAPCSTSELGHDG